MPFKRQCWANESHREAGARTIRQSEQLLRQVDRDLGLRIGPVSCQQLLVHLLAHHHGQEPVLQGVALENVGEGGRDDRPDPPADERPGRVLTRRTAAEVVACEQDLRALRGREIERKVRLVRAIGVVAPVAEQALAEAILVDHLQEARGDDLIGVDVLGSDDDGGVK